MTPTVNDDTTNNMSVTNESEMAELPPSPREEAEDARPSFENVLDELGMPGRFQLTQLIVIFNALSITAFMAYGFVFQAYTPPHVCNTVNDTELFSTYGLQNDSTAKVTYGSCDVTVSTNQSGQIKDVAKLSCPDGRNFSGAEHTTWISEWDLVCESKGRAELCYSIFTVGQIVGGLVAACISDRFGRKPTYIAFCAGAWIAETSIIFAPSIYVIMAIRFVSGVSYRGMVTVGYVHGMEFLAPRHRQIYGTTFGVVWVLHDLTVVTVAFVLKNYRWEYFQGVTSAFGIFIVFCFIMLQESPRWLAANGKIDEALAVLKKAGKQNKKDGQRIKELFLAYVHHTFPPATQDAPLIPHDKSCVDEKCTDSDATSVKYEKTSVLSLLKHKSLLITTLITTYIWLTHVVVYYGLLMTASKLAGDRFLNFVLLIVVEIPGCAGILLATSKFGRRLTIGLCLGLTGVSLMASTLFSMFGQDLAGADILTTVFFILGKFAIFVSFSVLYIVTPELFPTNLRSTGIGFCGSVSRVGGMVAPFMSLLHDVINWGPMMVFTVMCVVAMALIMFLPETKGRDLPSTIQEILDQKTKTTREKQR